MLLPKKTFVALAGQNAWHICTGVALPRDSGKYLPSQLRTQNAGPEADAAGRGGGAGCWLRPNRSAKKVACPAGWRGGFLKPPKKKSKTPSPGALQGRATALGNTSTAPTTTPHRP